MIYFLDFYSFNFSQCIILRASSLNLRGKINTELLPKLNYFTEVAQHIMDSKQNIVWFDGEVCVMYKCILHI